MVRKSDKRREELLNSVNIPSDAKAVARNEILRSLLNVIPNADLLYTNRILTNIVEKIVDLSLNTSDFFLRVADLIVSSTQILILFLLFFQKDLLKCNINQKFYSFNSERELPEIFDDNRIPEATIEYVNRTIHFQIEKGYEDLVNYTVMYNVIPTRKATRPFQIGGKVKPTGRE